MAVANGALVVFNFFTMAVSSTSRKSLAQTLGVVSIVSALLFSYFALISLVDFIKLNILFEGVCLPDTIIVGFYSFLLLIIGLLFLSQGYGLLKFKKWLPTIVIVTLILTLVVNVAYFIYDLQSNPDYWAQISTQNYVQQLLPTILSLIISIFTLTNKKIFTV